MNFTTLFPSPNRLGGAPPSAAFKGRGSDGGAGTHDF